MAQLQESKPEEKGRSKNRRGLHIDMTPMVDLAFLLLTFFVMTSALTKPHAMGLDMPDDSVIERQPIPASRVLNLILDEGDKIYWYSGENSTVKTTSFSPNGVRKLLREKKGHISKMYVLIKPSDKSKYKNVIDILDEMEISEIERYTLVNVDDADKRLIAESNL